ncbi:hypothetical protein HWV62_805 [Athelia sp. TMB]|nr:hypothetical protein HWV62_805 [Athelia sp. TMB]
MPCFSSLTLIKLALSQVGLLPTSVSAHACTSPQPVASSSNLPQSYPQQPQQHPQPAYPPPASYPQAKSEPADLSALLALSQAGPIPTSASEPPAPAIGNIANLWQSLLKAGVVSSTGTPTGAGETAKVEETTVEAVDPPRLAAREYRKSILAQKMKLTSTSIKKTRPNIVQFLYDRLSVQCKQRGIRFAESTSGKKDMQDHLDMHFRPQPPAYPPPASYPQAKSEPADLSALLALSQAGPIPTSASAPPAPAIGNIANLWQSLLKAGVVSSTGTPTGAGETAKVEETKVEGIPQVNFGAKDDARQFAPMVSQLFLDSYREVDHSTRSKMEEMLLTWRNGGANGKELFGVVPQVAIERGVWGGGPTQSNQSVGFHQGPGHISKSQVISELEFVLGQKERALQSNPYDEQARNNIGVLHTLRGLVEAGVPQNELRQILTQMRSLSQQAPMPPPPPQPPAYPPPASYPQAKSEPADLSALLALSQAGPIPTSASAPPAPAIGNIANLWQSLLKAGVVSSTGTPTGAGETAKVEETTVEAVDPPRLAAREYRKSILAQKMRLTSTSITK